MKRLIFIAISLLAMAGFSAGAQQVEKENAELIVAVNTDWGVGYFTDAEGRLLFKKQFEAVEPFFEGLAAVKKDGLYGYINTKGEFVVPCVYDKIHESAYGVALVQDGEIFKIVNKDGKVIVSECLGESTFWTLVNK